MLGFDIQMELDIIFIQLVFNFLQIPEIYESLDTSLILVMMHFKFLIHWVYHYQIDLKIILVLDRESNKAVHYMVDKGLLGPDLLNQIQK